jgi:hypothetical protein
MAIAGWVISTDLFRRDGGASPHGRWAGGVLAVLVPVGVLGGLGALEAAVQGPAPAESVRTTLIYLPPPPAPSRPAAPQPPSQRPSVTTPDNPAIRRPDDAPQTWITAPAETATAPQAPTGLRGLIEKDPCLDPAERLRRPDCPLAFDPKRPSRLETAIEEKLARDQFLAFATRENCSVTHGCMDGALPTEVMGVRKAKPGTAMSAGASSLGGLHDSIGRLDPPNWYHVDPAFGD